MFPKVNTKISKGGCYVNDLWDIVEIARENDEVIFKTDVSHHDLTVMPF